MVDGEARARPSFRPPAGGSAGDAPRRAASRAYDTSRQADCNRGSGGLATPGSGRRSELPPPIGIGGSLAATAPTPPCIRVRTRRFGGFKRPDGVAAARPPGVRVGTRHAGFGPSVSGAAGFTLRLRLQGQFQLDVLPPDPHERTVLVTLFIVQAFAGEQATMPSADFCAATTALAELAQSEASGHGADLPR